MYFDSHVHIDSVGAIPVLIERALTAGVDRILAVGGSPALNRCAIAAARRFPQNVQAAIGWDRDQANLLPGRRLPDSEPVITAGWQLRVERCRKIGVPIAALGEIGLDYHHALASADAQRRLMRLQLAVARALRLPVIVHSRDADDDTLVLLTEHRAAWMGPLTPGLGVLHCFTGNANFAQRLLELDFFISFSGIVTFANAVALRDVVPCVPDQRLLIETDTPYLAPVPYRGQPNQPAFLPAIAQRIAGLRGVTIEDLAATTRANAATLFGSPDMDCMRRVGVLD